MAIDRDKIQTIGNNHSELVRGNKETEVEKNYYASIKKEIHLDFDDGFSWVVPYEIGAVLSARRAHGLPIPPINHPLFDLPTAHFELAQGPLTHYQDIYAHFIRGV